MRGLASLRAATSPAKSITTAIYPGVETVTCVGFSMKQRRSFSRAALCRVRCEHGGFSSEKGSAPKRAAVAVARKLAVIMHTMLKTGEFFNATAGVTA